MALGGAKSGNYRAHHLRPLVADFAIEPVQLGGGGLDRGLIQAGGSGGQVASQGRLSFFAPYLSLFTRSPADSPVLMYPQSVCPTKIRTSLTGTTITARITLPDKYKAEGVADDCRQFTL
jgi:hypothetical protein